MKFPGTKSTLGLLLVLILLCSVLFVASVQAAGDAKQGTPGSDETEVPETKGKPSVVKMVKANGEEIEMTAEEMMERTKKEEAKRKNLSGDRGEETLTGKGRSV